MSIWDEPDVLLVGGRTTVREQYRIGLTIRRMRLAANLTQDELANAICVSRAAVAQWETLRTNPSMTSLPFLAKSLNVNIVDFFKE